MMVSLATPLCAQVTGLQQRTPVQKQIVHQSTNANVTKSRILGKGITEQVITLPNGLKMKTVVGFPQGSNILNPKRHTMSKAPEVREGYVLYEDFEAWDGTDAAWMPEGWLVDHRNSPTSNRGWKMTQPMSAYDYIDSKCATYELFEEDVNEWLVTPEFTVTSGMELRWSTMTSPYFYDWAYFNSTTFQLEQYVIVNDIKVNISTDGGTTWENLFSHAEDLKETAPNFFAMFDYSVRPFTLPLTKYAGKTVKIGFQIVGKDGNTTFLDNVSVGFPPTRTAYTAPLSNLYFGLSASDENVPVSIMVGPVYQPIKFTNATKTTGAEFTWTYTATNGEEAQTSNERDLTITYHTDYTDAFTTRNNLYTFPLLRGSSATTAPDEFSYSGFLQAGGKGEYERYYTDTQEYEVVDLGLTIIDPVTEGSATYADLALPYFGYNNESDRYWSEYTFGKGGMDDNNWSHLEKIADFFYASDAPIVINGVRTIAYGKISKEAKFTAEIYLLNAGYMIGNEPYATAVCTGDDITVVDRYSTNDLLSLNFKFDAPIVMSKKVAPYFLVAISGFRDADHIEYFSPEMSNYSNPNNLGLGWVGTEICWAGDTLPLSWTPVANYTDDELVSFYIMLDADFPWLEGDDTIVDIASGTTASVQLDSYYDGSQLQFEGLPDWLTATATGRYGETLVTFTAKNMTDASATVTVRAPGVSKDITVNGNTTGISSIAQGDAHDDTAIYTIDGRRVYAKNLGTGIYIQRTGTKVTKFVVTH